MPVTVDTPTDSLDQERLLRDAVGVALRDEHPDAFLAWVRARLGDYLGVPAPRPGAHGVDWTEDDRAAAALAWQLGRAIWNGLPLPSNHFKPRPLPSPGRNDACPCGSGVRRRPRRLCGRQCASRQELPVACWRTDAAGRTSIRAGFASAVTMKPGSIVRRCAMSGRRRRAPWHGWQRWCAVDTDRRDEPYFLRRTDSEIGSSVP